MINAIHDLTEKDIATMRYRQLQSEQAAWNLQREIRNPNYKPLFSWRRVNITRKKI
jgi:hypothetical protein